MIWSMRQCLRAICKLTTMVSDERIDNLALSIEQQIKENEEFLVELPDFPPRDGKYAADTSGPVIPLEDLQ